MICEAFLLAISGKRGVWQEFWQAPVRLASPHFKTRDSAPVALGLTPEVGSGLPFIVRRSARWMLIV